MAQSIKLGNDTYIDWTGVMLATSNATFKGTLEDRLGTIYTGAHTMSDMRLSAIGAKIAEYKSVYRPATGSFVLASGATQGYFQNSTVLGLWVFWSANYGCAMLMSDSTNLVVFGRYATGSWTWQHPTLTTVT